MIRILLDECLPVKLKYRFSEISPDFKVSTVVAEEWTGLKDDSLLQRMEQKFDVFITIDKDLSYQQKLSTLSIAVVVLEAGSNRYKDLVNFVEPASEIIESEEIGSVYNIALQY